MAFPTSPSNGQVAVVNNVYYTYNSTTNSWLRTIGAEYLGNLTIQEYRSLLGNERLFLVVDKPLTRILPELHEYNDEFIEFAETWLSHWLGYVEESVFDVNILVIDEKNIIEEPGNRH